MATLTIDLPIRSMNSQKSRAAAYHGTLSKEVVQILAAGLGEPPPLTVPELQGLARDLWTGIDAAHHVDRERRSWPTLE